MKTFVQQGGSDEMVVTALAPSTSAGSVERGATRLAIQIAQGLAGRAPDRVLGADEVDSRVAIAGSDLLVVAAEASDGGIAPTLLEFLGGVDLRGSVAFLTVIGSWPEEANTADRLIRPLLTGASVLCPAPTLHVVDAGSPAVAAYCRFWAPPVKALVLRARTERSAA